MKITTQAIRPDNIGFSTERKLYLKYAQQGKLPQQLKHLAYSLPWPIDMEDPDMHLANFSTPQDIYIASIMSDNDIGNDDGIDKFHMGIDIQSIPGTKIKPLESGIVTGFVKDTLEKREHLANIYITSQSTNITWVYSHLSLDSIPTKIKNQGTFYFDKETTTGVDQNDFIGEVGSWEEKLPLEITVPQDVESVYGREFHHLDLSAFEFDKYGLSLSPSLLYLNPLLFLKKLYAF